MPCAVLNDGRFLFIGLAFFFFLSSCEKPEDSRFIKRTAQETGIDFQNTITSTPELNILNYIYFYNGAGVAVADFNNDGLDDIYFTANQTSDRLYLNQGDLKFNEITKEARIDNSANWTSGVTTVDINQDGWMDIYICKLGSYKGVTGKNLLYVNQGLNKDGLPRFEEDAASYNLDFKGFSTQASFFDYDLDGDLDVYFLNHSVNPNQNYRRGDRRKEISPESGDKLYENVAGRFKDVSEEAGIFQGKIGYGLGVSVSDINADGFPDLYVGNDFYENDYLYINNGDKTFTEIIHSDENYFGHTTHFSMGNDVADLNNDGLPDIVSLDMLPEDLETYKTSGTEFSYQIYQNYINNGYAPQFMQNTLQLNKGNATFSETAYLSGLAATEWSWSPLIADYDNDGHSDVYITNGIPGATNDMDFINFIADESIQRALSEGVSEEEMAFIEKIPSKRTRNYFFQNNKSNTFTDVTEVWSPVSPTFSNGAAYSDFDNDGDLDLVVNNINEAALFLENTTSVQADSLHFLKIELQGEVPNRNGIGAKINAYAGNEVISRENYTTRGYLSAVNTGLHLGLGAYSEIDSLQVIWPDKSYQVIYNVSTNRSITVNQKDASGIYDHSDQKVGVLLNSEPLFIYEHRENTTLEFNRDPLVPFALSNEGPDISIADVNQDGMDDVFICGAKGQASRLLIQQTDGSFETAQPEIFQPDALSEDTAALFFDANGDAYPDLIVASGGNEFTRGKALQPRFYLNNSGTFVIDTLQFRELALNASTVSAADIDNDGDQDLLFTADTFPQEFGSTPVHFVYENSGAGHFTDSSNRIASVLKEHGPITDVKWTDMDQDGYPELIALGHWSAVTLYSNSSGILTRNESSGLDDTNGWWKSVEVADIDNDGDLDIIAGNWGLNSRLNASANRPITLYNYDFDDNGKKDPVVTYFEGEIETPFASKDELVKQMPGLNKEFLSYHDFAQASIEDLFTAEKLNKAEKKTVFELGSCYFENRGEQGFKKHLLPFEAQVSSVNDILVHDFNNDGFTDLFLVGNNFEISTQLSRLDASRGVLLLNDTQGNFIEPATRNFDVPGPGRTVKNLVVNGAPYLVITRNNDQPVFLKLNKRHSE